MRPRTVPRIVDGKKRGRKDRWLVTWRDAAGKQRLKTCRTREEAEDERDRIHEERKQTLAAGAPFTADVTMTLAQAFDRYFATCRLKSIAQHRYLAEHLKA